MKYAIRLAVVPAALALALAGPAAAQSGSSTTGAQSASPAQGSGAKERSNVARGDVKSMKQAAESGLAEVQGSQLAVDKASSEQVKAFAQKMIDDHTKVNDELKQLAAKKGVELPTEPSSAHKARLKMLSGAEGAEFDRQYAENLGVKAHEDSLKLFQDAAKASQDAEVKAFFASHVPALAEHLKMAKELSAATAKK